MEQNIANEGKCRQTNITVLQGRSQTLTNPSKPRQSSETALRRQRSGVRIPSGAPISSKKIKPRALLSKFFDALSGAGLTIARKVSHHLVRGGVAVLLSRCQFAPEQYQRSHDRRAEE